MNTLDLLDLNDELRQRNWLDDAACTLDDHRLLDPIVGAKPTPLELQDRQRGAQVLCADCPVRVQCATWADAHIQPGVWGGALRYRAGNSRYVSLPLTPQAVPSKYDLPLRDARRLLGEAVRELTPEDAPEEELVS
jgi:hypothetical protein